MTDSPYDRNFYSAYAGESARSAQTVVPFVCKLFRPSSVVDVGCGIGTWLRVFADVGVDNILGIDGDYVNRDQLVIDSRWFRARDLTQPLTLPSSTPERFDLAISLEVAEHIAPKHARDFVTTLTKLSDVVLFSAAIPHQGGTDHVNEQWPNYWAKLFAEVGYGTYDCVRPALWSNPDVAYYYAQNTLVYIKNGVAARYPHVAGFESNADDANLARVHPTKWEAAHDPSRIQLRRLLKALPKSAQAALQRRIRRR